MAEDDVPVDLAEVDVDADFLVVVSNVAEDVAEVISEDVTKNECGATCINQICLTLLV